MKTIVTKSSRPYNSSKFPRSPASGGNSSDRKDPRRKYIYRYKFTADYAWNKGGRLKELRRRHLARKYFFLWRKRSFGRILPSHAEFVVNRGLLKRAFELWKEVWWVNRKEWRLQVRADCHFNFKSLLTYFRAWQLYHEFKHNKKKDLKRAELSDERRICSVYFVKWKDELFKRIKLSHLCNEFQDAKNSFVVRKYFRLWMFSLEDKFTTVQTAATARAFRDATIQKYYFQLWRVKLNEKFFLDFKMNVILTERTRKYAKAFFEILHLQAISKRPIRRLRARANKFRRLSLLLRYFYTWTSEYEQSVQHKTSQLTINALARKVQLRRHFNAWRKCLIYRRNRDVQYLEAEFLQERSMKRKGFHALLLNVELNYKKVWLRRRADEFTKSRVQKKFFSYWSDTFDRRQDAKLQRKFRLAEQFYNIKLVSLCFIYWNHYTDVRRERSMKKIWADEFYAQHHMKLNFQKWRNAAERKRSTKLADEFCAKTLINSTFSVWRKALDFIQESRLLNHLAISFDEKRLKIGHIKRWQRALQKTRLCNEISLIFIDRQNFRTVETFFEKWRSVYLSRSEQFRDGIAADQYQIFALRRRYMNQWRQYVEYRKNRILQFAWADQFYLEKIQRRFIGGLKKAVEQFQHALQIVEAKENERNREILATVFKLWRQQSIIFVSKKLKADLAYAAGNRKLVLRCFTSWRLRTSVLSAKHDWKNHKIAHLHSIQRAILLRSYLDKWRQKSDELIIFRINLERAAIFEDRVCIKKAFKAWRQYQMICMKKLVLRKWADQFCNVRITASLFVVWRTKLAEVRAEQKKTLVGLWHWAFNLKASVFSAWFKYFSAKREKRSKEHEALHYRQDLLCRRAASHWIAVADTFWLKDQKFSGPSEINFKRRERHLAQKYGYKWRMLANKPRSQAKVEMKSEYITEVIPVKAVPKFPTWMPSKNRPMPRIPDFLIGEVERERVIKPGVALAANLNEKCLENTSERFSPKLLKPEDFATANSSEMQNSLCEDCPENQPPRNESLEPPLVTPRQLTFENTELRSFNNNTPFLLRQQAVVSEEENDDIRLIELKNRLELVMTLKYELSNLDDRLKSHISPEHVYNIQQRMEVLKREIESETQICRSLAEECQIDS